MLEWCVQQHCLTRFNCLDVYKQAVIVERKIIANSGIAHQPLDKSPYALCYVSYFNIFTGVYSFEFSLNYREKRGRYREGECPNLCIMPPVSFSLAHMKLYNKLIACPGRFLLIIGMQFS